MIRLFERDETVFDHNETPLPDVISAPVEEEANGMYELVIEYPRNEFAKTLTAGKLLKAPTPRGEQLFRIYKPIKNLKTYKIYARHIFYDLAKNFIENIRPTNTNASTAIDSILNGAAVAHNFTGYSDISNLHTANYVRKNPLEALMGADNSILNVWGGELVRDNFTFRIDAQGGQDRGYEIRLGKNLIGIEADIDESNVYTCIYPTVVIEDNAVTTLPEKYVYSPLVNNYESTYIIEERIDLTDDQKGWPLEDIYTLMRERSEALFAQGVDKPEINYKVDFVELSQTEQYKKLQILEQLDLYDTVTIIVDELDIEVQAKVIKTTYDALRERYKSMELGNFKQNLASQTRNTLGIVDKQLADVSGSIREAFEEANEKITGNLGGHIITRLNADGLPYEQLIMDTDDIQTATNVIRMNQEGIGFSDQGYNGPFGVAITIDGTINAEIANFINLNAESIVSGTLTGLKFINNFDHNGTAGQLIIDGSIDMHAGGVGYFLDENGLQFDDGVTSSKMGHDGLRFIRDGVESGSIVSHYYSTDGVSVIRFLTGDGTDTGLQINRNILATTDRDSGSNDRDLYISPSGIGEMIVGNGSGTFYGTRTDYVRFPVYAQISEFQSGGLKYDAPNDAGHQFTTNDQTRMAINSDRISFQRELDMNGYNIVNQSDRRLKHILSDTTESSLVAIDRWTFVDYEWKDLSKPDGPHMGLIAQDTPELVEYDTENDIYNINSSKQINMNSHAIQEMYREMQVMKQEIAELKQKVGG